MESPTDHSNIVLRCSHNLKSSRFVSQMAGSSVSVSVPYER